MELRASNVLGRYSTNKLHSSFFKISFYFEKGSATLPKMALNLWFCCLSFRNGRDDVCTSVLGIYSSF